MERGTGHGIYGDPPLNTYRLFDEADVQLVDYLAMGVCGTYKEYLPITCSGTNISSKQNPSLVTNRVESSVP